jgi:branched-chain amino acid transport system permease protein
MQNIVFGLITGSILTVATVGFSMIRQNEGFINIAHGQFLTVGAFLSFFLVDRFGLNVFVAGLATMLFVGVLGVLLARIVFQPVKRNGSLALLFTSIGLAYVLYGTVRTVFGADVRFFPVGFGPRFDLGPVNITLGEALVIGIAAVAVLALHLFLTRTRRGQWIRAVASNPDLARLRGVPVTRVSATVWFIGSSLAGLAGVMLGVLGNVNAELGWQTILLVLAVAVLGGLGQIYGVIAAGILLGLVMDLSALVIPTAYRSVVAFGALILALLIRPQGLFAIGARRDAT